MRRLLVPIDFSDASSRALSAALEREPDAELLVLHVVDGDFARRASQRTGLDPEELAEKAWSYADVRLEETVAQLRSRGANARALLSRGDPVEETLAAARREGATVIVVGVDEAGEREGRFRTSLARHSRTPVLLVPSD